MKQGGRGVGGCDENGDIDKLKTSWEQACKISRQAFDDLTFIQTIGTQTQGHGPDGNQDKAGRERWDRVYDMYIAMFGSGFNPDGTVNNLLLGSVLRKYYKHENGKSQR